MSINETCLVPVVTWELEITGIACAGDFKEPGSGYFRDGILTAFGEMHDDLAEFSAELAGSCEHSLVPEFLVFGADNRPKPITGASAVSGSSCISCFFTL